jgi:hypothetical protein
MAETTISTRVQELTAHFVAARPVEVDVAGVTIIVPIRPEASAACYERGAIPLTAGEFAWLTVARESLNGQLDIPTILRARAVLPAHAQLGGIVLTGEHSGDPYFHHAEHPTLVVCAHATPPVGKRPLLVVTPEEISELFEAGTGALADAEPQPTCRSAKRSAMSPCPVATTRVFRGVTARSKTGAPTSKWPTG